MLWLLFVWHFGGCLFYYLAGFSCGVHDWWLIIVGKVCFVLLCVIPRPGRKKCYLICARCSVSFLSSECAAVHLVNAHAVVPTYVHALSFDSPPSYLVHIPVLGLARISPHVPGPMAQLSLQ